MIINIIATRMAMHGSKDPKLVIAAGMIDYNLHGIMEISHVTVVI